MIGKPSSDLMKLNSCCNMQIFVSEFALNVDPACLVSVVKAATGGVCDDEGWIYHPG